MDTYKQDVRHQEKRQKTRASGLGVMTAAQKQPFLTNNIVFPTTFLSLSSFLSNIKNIQSMYSSWFEGKTWNVLTIEFPSTINTPFFQTTKQEIKNTCHTGDMGNENSPPNRFFNASFFMGTTNPFFSRAKYVFILHPPSQQKNKNNYTFDFDTGINNKKIIFFHLSSPQSKNMLIPDNTHLKNKSDDQKKMQPAAKKGETIVISSQNHNNSLQYNGCINYHILIAASASFSDFTPSVNREKMNLCVLQSLILRCFSVHILLFIEFGGGDPE